MRYLPVTIKDKIAKYMSSEKMICYNSDYILQFTFDAEWDSYIQKTAQIRYFSTNKGWVKHDIIFTGLECNVPVIPNASVVYVGVYAGDIRTTTESEIPCRPSVLSFDGAPANPPDDVYNQIMQKLNELEQSGVSPEQIAAAVEQYLTENPITAADVNAVPQNQGVENAGKFLSINESGEVIPVESGADGITPHIGANGNWYIGETDTGIKAQGENGADGTTPHIGANGNWWIGDTDTGVKADASGDYLPIPPTASVGQYFRVSDVDENGVVTAVEAVDAPSGGSETWTQLCDAELTEESNQINQSWVSTPMKKIKVLIETPAASANTTYMPTTVYTNDIKPLHVGRFYPTALPLKEATNIEYIIEVYNINDTVYMRFTEYSGGIHGVNNGVKGVIKLKDIISVETTGNDTYGNVLFEKIIGIQLQSYSTFGVGTKIKIWGIAL